MPRVLHPVAPHVKLPCGRNPGAHVKEHVEPIAVTVEQTEAPFVGIDGTAHPHGTAALISRGRTLVTEPIFAVDA